MVFARARTRTVWGEGEGGDGVEKQASKRGDGRVRLGWIYRVQFPVVVVGGVFGEEVGFPVGEGAGGR